MNDRATTRPLPLDYDNPRNASRGGRRLPPFSLPAFFATGAIMLLSGWILAIVVPRMEMLYKDYGLRLPAATQLLLDVARFLSQSGFLPAMILPVLVALLVPHLIPRTRQDDGKSDAPGRRLMAWAVALLLVNLVTFVVFIVVGVTLWLPMMNLMSNLAAPNAGK